ncbi:hypothetical protein [Nitrobacter sp.]|jgi:hypothetical protein|uniref:hypothetical protein n=1 Tax=Nitrobacter sp. TaxID=29420 RepID=UPI003F6515FE
MVVPKEFVYVVECFYQGSDEEVSTMEEWVAKALRCSDKQDQAAVKRFLQELLAQNLADAELQRIWNDAGANYFFEDIRGVLTLIRDAID